MTEVANQQPAETDADGAPIETAAESKRWLAGIPGLVLDDILLETDPYTAEPKVVRWD